MEQRGAFAVSHIVFFILKTCKTVLLPSIKAMPELPEVETVKRVLEPQIKGLYINHVTVRRPEVVAHPSAEEFCALLTGQHISNMMRRGKFLGVSLDSGDYFVLHLRMTGGLLFTPLITRRKSTRISFLK